MNQLMERTCAGYAWWGNSTFTPQIVYVFPGDGSACGAGLLIGGLNGAEIPVRDAVEEEAPAPDWKFPKVCCEEWFSAVTDDDFFNFSSDVDIGDRMAVEELEPHW